MDTIAAYWQRAHALVDGTGVPTLETFALAVLLALWLLARRRRRAIEAEVETARLLLRHTADGVLLLDRKARIREANPAACQLLEAARRNLLGQPADKRLGPRLEMRNLRQWASGGMSNVRQFRVTYAPPPPGKQTTLDVAVHVRRGFRARPVSYLCLIRPHAFTERAPERKVSDSGQDGLTGLPSRGRFLQRLERAVIQMIESGGQHRCTVLVLNLDRFRQVNDHLGPALADQAMVAVAERLSRAAEGAYLARLDGDRFGVLVEGKKRPADIHQLVERLQTSLARPLRVQGHELRLSAAVGIVPNAHDYKRAADLLRDATIAVSGAKAKGLGQWQLFDQAMGEFVVKGARIEADLRKALENGELRPVFQPIVDVRRRKVAGFEALVRWRHPEHGEISPAEFVDIAEESEHVVPIGRELRSASCRMLAAWQLAIEDPDLYLSFNLTDYEARRPELIEELAGYLDRHGLSAGSVRIELVERMLLVEDTRRALDGIVSLGLPLYIDDFGTGYSSLSRLHDAPVHTLKIDRSFVQQMTVSDQGLQVVKSIIGLARNLDVRLLAEGVETGRQLRMLTDLGCYSFQGYLFAPPVEADQVPKMLGDQRWVERCIDQANRAGG